LHWDFKSGRYPSWRNDLPSRIIVWWKGLLRQSDAEGAASQVTCATKECRLSKSHYEGSWPKDFWETVSNNRLKATNEARRVKWL
jgi:hypothetical protein